MSTATQDLEQKIQEWKQQQEKRQQQHEKAKRKLKQQPEYKAVQEAADALIKAVEAAKNIDVDVFIGLRFKDPTFFTVRSLMAEPDNTLMDDAFNNIMDGIGPSETKHVGWVGVESGNIVFADPCLVKNLDYDKTIDKLLDGPDEPQPIDLGKEGQFGDAVAFHTGKGDGFYKVFAGYRDGELVNMTVDVTENYWRDQAECDRSNKLREAGEEVITPLDLSYTGDEALAWSIAARRDEEAAAARKDEEVKAKAEEVK